MQCSFLFHCKNGSTNVTQYYVIVHGLIVVKVTEYYYRGKSRDDIKFVNAGKKKYGK